MRKILFFELNEVPFSILDYYVEKYPNSTLAKVLPLSFQYETVNEDEGHLSPWITWPTLHRGVTNHQHKIQDFGEDLSQVDQTFPPIWKILMSHKLRTGVFASMHSYPIPENYRDYAFYVPDPFAGDSRSHPDYIVPFQHFNLVMSRKSGRNVDSGIDLKSASALALKLPVLGIKPATLGQVVAQLAKERVKPWIKTRRRTYQSVLAFDVFMKLMYRQQPDFTTCFSNHVASTMHRYWAATFPNDYEEFNMDNEWKETYSGEIDFTLHIFDRFLAQMVDFVKKHPVYRLVVTSSMGQSATEAEKLRTELACKDMTTLMNFLGLNENDWEARAAMHPQYNLYVPIAENQEKLTRELSKIEVANKPLSFRQKEGGFFSLDFGHKNLEGDYVVYGGKQVSFSEMGIRNEPIEDETGSTAYHIPEGSLLVYDPQQEEFGKRQERQLRVSSTALVPSMLENYKLSVPDYMVKQRIEALV